jgi:very-short-patch-repair endonuclease
VVDFYCASQKLIIELDGGIHDTEQQNIKDKIREDNLKAMGFKILRF